ncbi:MAG: hypothetical protein HYX34_15905 [Actinobacteria bacterium]|nr:hypothetical protein [Actinomycetota bacterium]
MTEISTVKDVIGEALGVIDRSLAALPHRDLVSSSEMSDLLLDLRLLLMSAAEEPEPAAPSV